VLGVNVWRRILGVDRQTVIDLVPLTSRLDPFTVSRLPPKLQLLGFCWVLWVFRKPKTPSDLVRPLGFEPRTCGLRE
jgi:hypothetical protein